MRRSTLPLLVLLLQPAASALQMGDQKGEAQPPLPADLAVPPAPVLSPADARAAFTIEPGYSIELVAAEPLVHDPVVAVWDEGGRLWVCEMRDYMPTIDGKGEDQPTGDVVVLSDEDGDGRLETRTVFLDGLVLPRAIHPCEDGCLVLAPPELVLWHDADGDGHADARELVDDGLPGLANPEHATNGLLYQVDNWYRVADGHQRYRRVDGAWRIERTAGGGQWGLTQDDLGRAVFNTNPDPVRGDLFPSHYAVRNPNHGTARGVNVRLAHDMEVWPARINPGVNRGYREGTLRDDWTLRVFTAACGPLIQRGDAFPADERGDVFVCEPAGNLVKRYRIESPDGVERSAVPVYEHREFLASTDERFRPVNMVDAPDGSITLVDLHRGLIQHRIFLTTWLRNQILARGLEAPLGLGRIWRVAPEGAAHRAAPRLDEASWKELVQALSSPNGWTRETAQRLLVEDGGDSLEAYELLRAAALGADAPLGRMHALWALEGVHGTDPAFVARMLADPDPRVLNAAVRVSEPWMASGDPDLAARVAAVAGRGDAGLRLQVLLSLGSAATRAGDGWLARFVTESCADEPTREAVLSGLFQRELRFVETLCGEDAWSAEAPGRAVLLRALARCVVRQGIGAEVERLLELALASPPWRQAALLDGVLAARRKDPKGGPGHVRLGAEPPAAEALRTAGTEAATAAYDALAWPGKPGLVELEVRPLTEEESRRFARGAEIYASICSACHQPSGLGEPGKAPPLRDSPWPLGDPALFGRILLNGLHGPVELDDETWDAEMPAYTGSDEDAAAVMTYVRREWGHGADPVAPDFVHALRASIADHARPWTLDELRALGASGK